LLNNGKKKLKNGKINIWEIIEEFILVQIQHKNMIDFILNPEHFTLKQLLLKHDLNKQGIYSIIKINNQSFFFFFLFHRAQIDEIQKKQDKLNAFKNRKLPYNGSSNNLREIGGESPTRRPLPTIKSSRSSSITRPVKRLTAVGFIFVSSCPLLALD